MRSRFDLVSKLACGLAIAALACGSSAARPSGFNVTEHGQAMERGGGRAREGLLVVVEGRRVRTLKLFCVRCAEPDTAPGTPADNVESQNAGTDSTPAGQAALTSK